MKCSRCGTELPKGTDTCLNCGAKRKDGDSGSLEITPVLKKKEPLKEEVAPEATPISKEEFAPKAQIISLKSETAKKELAHQGEVSVETAPIIEKKKGKPIFLIISVGLLIIGLGGALWGATYLKEKRTNDAVQCIRNLKLIQEAKVEWAKANGKDTFAIPAKEDLKPHLKGFPTCPSGGEYIIRRIGSDPVCSIQAHRIYLEDTYKTSQ